MKSLARFSPHRFLGFRGSVLMIFGFIEIIVAWSISGNPIMFKVFNEEPHQVYVLLWLIPGLISLATSFFTKAVEAFGFAISFIPFFLWGAGYLVSFYPNHDLTAEQAFKSIAVWWGITALILLISRWPEPPELPGDGKDGNW